LKLDGVNFTVSGITNENISNTANIQDALKGANSFLNVTQLVSLC